jgi:hypothetical protein
MFQKYEVWVRAKPHRTMGMAVAALTLFFVADTLVLNRPSWALAVHIAALSVVMFGAIVGWFAVLPYILRKLSARFSVPDTRATRLLVALGFLAIASGGAYLIETITQLAFDRVGVFP